MTDNKTTDKVPVWKHGSIFDTTCDAFVVPVNCKGVMGAGIALEYKRRYPNHFEAYKILCERGDMNIGECAFMGNKKDLHDKVHVFFPTKDDWRQPSKLEDVEDGLVNLMGGLKTQHEAPDGFLAYTILSIAIPALGCGKGGLDWEDIKPRLEAFAEESPVPTELYHPHEGPGRVGV